MGGALGESFALGAQAVAAPDALLLGVGAQVGRFQGVEGFCDALLVGALTFVVGAAEPQIGAIWGDATVVTKNRVKNRVRFTFCSSMNSRRAAARKARLTRARPSKA